MLEGVACLHPGKVIIAGMFPKKSERMIFVGCLMHFIVGYILWSSNTDTRSRRCWLMTLMLLEDAGKLKNGVLVFLVLETSSNF